ncbi:AMP-binding protein [Bradyrhizobium sp. LMTR 3]|uniref:class I adenylate-forming enzyme family protein n=1 Tax=Bradyrhizobium sp. LMTR 3 TaxID=189873 RepID=UPI000A04D9B5|nr:AMP-binding protein [Bradyrhizobium sp. LMTR 3]
MNQLVLQRSYWPADGSRNVQDISIGEALAQAANAVPDRLALVEVVPSSMKSPVKAAQTGREWTFHQLHSDARCCASWLSARFSKGDRVCIWAPNVPEWIVLQYGAALSGLVLVTANPALKPSELRYVIEQSRSRAIFHLEQFRGVDTGSVARQMEEVGIQRYSFDGWLEEVRGTTEAVLPDVDPGLPAQIQYTSGTTGQPKGALLRHRALVTNASYVAVRAGLDGSVLVSPMPLFHTAGSVMSVLGSVTTRSTLILPLLFEPSLVLDAIATWRAQVVFGVPTMLLAMIEQLKSAPRDLTSLRAALSGGAPVPPELHKRVRQALKTPLMTVYGQTELSPIVSQTTFDDPEDKRVHTVGRPLWNVEVRIADSATFEALPLESEGEIQVRGYQTMIEYFDKPEETRETITKDGWLRTGDLGKMDACGYLQITGRLKDMIIRGGENIYPVEIEACLIRHPDVADVAVFGVPDATWGEVVAAAVRITSDSKTTAEELVNHCRKAMAPHKAPTLWFGSTEFPLTASGKVQKFKLREALANGALHPLP